MNVIVSSLRSKIKSSLDDNQEAIQKLAQEKMAASKKNKEMVYNKKSHAFINLFNKIFLHFKYRKRKFRHLKKNWKTRKICAKQFYLWWANERKPMRKIRFRFFWWKKEQTMIAYRDYIRRTVHSKINNLQISCH